mmetsp:Transcript_10263/g.32451  ORF Transcript_10263/g.32451 Transcript_10263/m.32451 type:complete len:202 (+) Transcript_10263:1648-2253(+)
MPSGANVVWPADARDAAQYPGCTASCEQAGVGARKEIRGWGRRRHRQREGPCRGPSARRHSATPGARTRSEWRSGGEQWWEWRSGGGTGADAAQRGHCSESSGGAVAMAAAQPSSNGHWGFSWWASGWRGAALTGQWGGGSKRWAPPRRTKGRGRKGQVESRQRQGRQRGARADAQAARAPSRQAARREGPRRGVFGCARE